MKYIKLYEEENQKPEYSIYEIITMTPGMAEEVLVEQIISRKYDYELIKNLITISQANPNVFDKESYYTILLAMTSAENLELVKEILNHPVIIDIDWTDDRGMDAIMISIVKNNIEILRELLNYKRSEIDINKKSGIERSAFWLAVNYGNVEIVKELLKIPDINVNTHDKYLRTPLMIACHDKKIEMIELLLEDPRTDIECRDNWAYYAWNLADKEIKDRFPQLKPEEYH